MSQIPFRIANVSGTILATLFENSDYKSTDTNLYEIQGSLRFNLDASMNISYKTILAIKPVFIDGEWHTPEKVTSKKYKIDSIPSDSQLDQFIQMYNDEEVDDEINKDLDKMLASYLKTI